MWYLPMTTAQRPVAPVARPDTVQRLVAALGALVAGRYAPVGR